MNFKDIFKRGKHKKHGSESHGTPSRADTPRIEAGSTGPNPKPTSSMLALVTQPIMRRPVSSLHQNRPKGDWPNLATFSRLLNQSGLFGPLAEVIDDLCWFVGAHE
ncbi:hypothetical protein FRC11_003383, partial [Ceratobasidium sp. 423]